MKDQLLLSGNILSIDCEDRCSQTFLALLLKQSQNRKILFVSSQNYLLIKSELKHLKMLTELLNRHKNRIDFFFIKTPFSKIKERFFSKFENIIKDFDGEYIYFDRIDYFVDIDDEGIYQIVENIVKIVKSYNKKILFVYNSDSQKSMALKDVLDDLSIHIKSDNKTILSDKEVTMAHGQIESEEFELDKESLVELSLLEERDDLVKNIQVALISDNEDIKKLNYYLFSGVKGIDYFTIDSLNENELFEIDKMDIIIFNKNDDVLKEMLLHNIKAKNLNTKFFIISNRSYLRQKDILQEHINGVDKLLKMDFFLEDYILSMEKFLYNNFYSKRLLAHEDEKDVVIKDKSIFEKKVDNLLNEKIFFSLFSYHYDSEIDIENYNIRKIVRECDLIYIDEKEQKLTFLLLNVIPEFGSELIKKRINNFSITLKELNRVSAFDIIYEN